MAKNKKKPIVAPLPPKANAEQRSNLPNEKNKPITNASTTGNAPHQLFENLSKSTASWVSLLLLLIVAGFIFKNYLLQNDYYLFTDLGSDSVNTIYPQLLHLHRYLRVEGIPAWSFYQGLGQNAFPFWFDQFYFLLLFLDKANIPGSIIYVQVLEMVFSGWLFSKYLRLLPVSNMASWIGGICYGFCGFIVLAGGWDNRFSVETFNLALLLLALERYLQGKGWSLLPIPIALTAINQPFDLFIFTLFIVVYVGCRFLDMRGWQLSGLLTTYLKIAAICALGVAISTLVSLSNVLQLLESPRVSGGASLSGGLITKPFFELADLSYYITLMYRSFASEMQGTGSNYLGWYNYFEAPITYCSIVALVAAPQFFVQLDPKRRLLYGFAGLLVLLTFTIPYLRYTFWAFSGDYFRTLALFSTVLLLFMCAKVVSNLSQGHRLNIWVLIATIIVSAILLYYPYIGIGVNPSLRRSVTIYMVMEALVLVGFSIQATKRFAPFALLCLVSVEVIHLSTVSVSNRDTVKKQTIEDKKLYNDETEEALTLIRSKVKAPFRIDKDYHSGPSSYMSPSDAKAQDYFSTLSYHSFNQMYYVKFLDKTGLIDSKNETDSRWIDQGMVANSLLESLSNVRYFFAKVAPTRDMLGLGYDSLTTVKGVRVFYNRFYLPFGCTFDKYILTEDWESLDFIPRKVRLIEGIVIQKNQEAKFAPLIPQIKRSAMQTGDVSFETYTQKTNALKQDTLAISEFGQNKIKGSITLKQPKVMFFSIPFDKGWKATVDNKPAEVYLVHTGFMGLILDKGTHQVELYYERPLQQESLIITSLGLLVYAGMIILTRKKA